MGRSEKSKFHKKESHTTYRKNHPEYFKEYQKNWCQKHPTYNKDYYQKNKGDYYQKNKEKRINSSRNYRQFRKKIFNLLGNKCVRCGFIDERALQIDHLKGGGNQKRKGFSAVGYYNFILESIKTGSQEYQLLCANCNWIKWVENKEYG